MADLLPGLGAAVVKSGPTQRTVHVRHGQEVYGAELPGEGSRVVRV